MQFDARRFAFLAAAAVLAFKTALMFQQLAFFFAMKAAQCSDAKFTMSFGPGGGEAHGIESCTSGAATVVAAVGVFAGLAVAIPILWLFVRGIHPKWRFPSAFLYLLAIGAVAEVLSSAVIFSLAGRYEAAVLIENGVPIWLVIAAGLIAGAVLSLPIRRTTPYFAVNLLQHPESHVPFFQKAIWFKLTVGVGIISLIRIAT